MNSSFFLKSFRILLFPFAILYWLIIWIRNKLYDKNIFQSTSFGLPVICVGNLSVGGTGKSPMVEFLIKNLVKNNKIAILSRGYMRKTKGYALADAGSTALEIGDEPMQFHIKFPEIAVAVGEQRIEAIPQLLHDCPEINCIILDDAFQHRAVKAGLNILLTEYNNLFTRDFIIPVGDLRDIKSSYKRADLIIVTKCDPALTIDDKKEIEKEINPLEHQRIFFTANKYSHPYHIKRREEIKKLSSSLEILLVTGIANPQPLKDLLLKESSSYNMLHFPDHHIFSIDDWNEIKKKYEQMESEKKIILTTEKDAVRLSKFGLELEDYPLFVIPLEHYFLFDTRNAFMEEIENFIKNFKKIVN